jgi:hypothetical protein
MSPQITAVEPQRPISAARVLSVSLLCPAWPSVSGWLFKMCRLTTTQVTAQRVKLFIVGDTSSDGYADGFGRQILDLPMFAPADWGP